jgi:hypothetical protein
MVFLTMRTGAGTDGDGTLGVLEREEGTSAVSSCRTARAMAVVVMAS